MPETFDVVKHCGNGFGKRTWKFSKSPLIFSSENCGHTVYVLTDRSEACCCCCCCWCWWWWWDEC